MKLALIFGPDGKLSADLTKAFTGCRAYHIAFVCEESGVGYDQHWLFRRFHWDGHYPADQVVLFDCPFPMTEAELREEMLRDIDALCDSSGPMWQRLLKTLYGMRDYSAFALRPLYHLLGRSTPNYAGRICSGRIRDMGAERGWFELGTADDPEPSPCDWLRWLIARAPETCLPQFATS